MSTAAATSSPSAPATTDRQRLPLRTLLSFGVGDLGPAIHTSVYGWFMLNFLINVAGLRPGAAGTIFALTKVWDAVNDPLVGWLTDRTTSRLGRRRPWLLFGAVPFGLAFLLHWLVPPLSETGKFFYYLVVGLLLDTTLTIVLVPYTALTPELTPDYDERTRLTSVRLAFSIVGGVLAAFFHTRIVDAFADPVLGNAASAAVWAVFLTAPWFITVAGTRESEYATSGQAARDAAAGPGFGAGLRTVFANRAFKLVTIIYLLSWLTVQFIQTNLYVYFKDWVYPGSGLAGSALDVFGYLLLAIQLSAFVWLLIWARVSERLGKQGVYYLGIGVMILVLLGIFMVQPGQVGLVFALAVTVGVGVAVVYLVPWSMMPDVVEEDELRTGQRREGLFYGFFAFTQKLGVGAGLFISGWVLDLAGYIRAVPGQPDPAQPQSALLALRVLVGPVGAVILLLSVVAVYLYPITRERHAAIRAELRARGLPE